MSTTVTEADAPLVINARAHHLPTDDIDLEGKDVL